MKTKPKKSFLKTRALTLLVMLLTATTAWASDVKQLPYTEDFENGMGCWQVVNGNAITGINDKYEDTKAFAFWGNGPQYLISPQIESLADIKVSLYYAINENKRNDS